MKVGDLVHFVQPRIGHYEVKEDTLGIVLGFHSTSGRVRVQWFDDFMVLLNENNAPNYWQWVHLKVIENSS